MILLPQVHMIIQFHCLLLHQHRSRQVILRSQRNSSLHKEHQNWYHHKNDDNETEPYETDDTPVSTEEDIAQLQEEDVDTEPYTSDHSHFVDIDGTVFVPLGPKSKLLLFLVHAMLLGSNSLNSILPRMERSSQRQNQLSLKEVLRKYAKEIKQAKLEEFRSFLDFTAMTHDLQRQETS